MTNHIHPGNFCKMSEKSLSRSEFEKLAITILGGIKGCNYHVVETSDKGLMEMVRKNKGSRWMFRWRAKFRI